MAHHEAPMPPPMHPGPPPPHFPHDHFPQSGFEHFNPPVEHHPPIEQFQNFHLGNAPQGPKKKRPSFGALPSSQAGSSSAVYEGYTLRKDPNKGSHSWLTVLKTRMPVDDSELVKIVKESKGNVKKQLDKLRSQSQRMQIDRLIEDKNKAEQSKTVVWHVASVKEIRGPIPGNRRGETETKEIEVILKRLFKSDSGSGSSKDGNKESMRTAQLPGMLVDLTAKPKDSKDKVKAPKAPLGGAGQQVNWGPPPMQMGETPPHFIPPPPMPPQKGFPGAFPSGPGPGPQGDFFDPTMPVQIVEGSSPQGHGFHEPIHDNRGGHEAPRRRKSSRPPPVLTQQQPPPPPPRHHARHPSNALYDSSDDGSAGGSSRFTPRDDPYYSPISTPTDVSGSEYLRHRNGIDYMVDKRRAAPLRMSSTRRRRSVDGLDELMAFGGGEGRGTRSEHRYRDQRPRHDRRMTSPGRYEGALVNTRREAADREARRLHEQILEEERQLDRVRQERWEFDRERERREIEIARRRDASPVPYRFGERSPRYGDFRI